MFCFALLATGAYIAFDVLDLDGSDLRGRPASGVAVAEPARAEAEGRLRQDHGMPAAAPPAVGAAAFRIAAPTHLATPRADAMATAARRDRILARAHIARSATRSDSPPADPA